MKLFIVISMAVVAAVALPNNYYQQQAPTPPRAPPAPPAPPPEAPPKYESPKYEAPKSYDNYERLALPKEPEHKILTHTFDTDHKGNYRLEVETSNGIRRQVQGQLKDVGSPEGPVVAKSGSYSYPGDDGKMYTVNWTADENGFHATGDHLPTPPPIPEEIRKSLEVPRIPEHQPDFKPEMKQASSYSYNAPPSDEAKAPSPNYDYSAPAPPQRAAAGPPMSLAGPPSPLPGPPAPMARAPMRSRY